MIGVASLEDKDLKNAWINKIFDGATHQSGLINHVASNSSRVRGSSSAMLVYCLNKACYEDVEAYNATFEDLFIDEYWGIQLVKENSDGSNAMDVDSGPVVFGYGASATIMNIKAQASINKSKAKRTWAAMNLIGVPVNIFSGKYYIFKKEPMLDLFMLWGSTEL